MIGVLLATGGILFACGLAGVLMRRNLLVLLMSLELLLAGVGLTFVTFARARGVIDGQVMVFFMIIVAAVEAGVGFGLVLALFRRNSTLNSQNLSRLRW